MLKETVHNPSTSRCSDQQHSWASPRFVGGCLECMTRFRIVMGYNIQQTLLWCFYPNIMITILHCYTSVFCYNPIFCPLAGPHIFGGASLLLKSHAKTQDSDAHIPDVVGIINTESPLRLIENIGLPMWTNRLQYRLSIEIFIGRHWWSH